MNNINNSVQGETEEQPKIFTQEDVDEIIKNRLARERKKFLRLCDDCEQRQQCSGVNV